MQTNDKNAYNIVASCSTEQTSECDDRRQAGEVHEEEGSDTLDVQGILIVAQVPWSFTLDIVDEAAKQAKNNSINIVSN